MTTIAWDADSMTLAADSKVTEGDNEFPSQKIWRLADGRLFGAAGDGGMGLQVKRWLEAGAAPEHKPQLLAVGDDAGSFAALLVERDGRAYFLDEYLEPMEILRRFHAIGSGGRVATKLMENGKTATEAVTLVVALELDDGTGGPVQGLKLEDEHGKRH